MQRNGVVILASVALAAVAIIVAAYFFTHKPEPEPVDLNAHNKAAEIACLEGGGTWSDPSGFNGICEHSSVQPPAAPAVAPGLDASGGGNGCFGPISIDDCIAAKNVKLLVFKNTGYHMTTSIDGIVGAGHETCRILGPNPSQSEIEALAQTTADTLNVSTYVGIHVLAALQGNFCPV